jgi:hypothetical protein
VQFSAVGLDAGEMPAFLAAAKARGLPVKWFGADKQAGFTSAPRHWHYAGEQGDLAATHRVLATLCDIRTPVSLTDAECDLIAEIVREAIELIVAERGAVISRPHLEPVVVRQAHHGGRGRGFGIRLDHPSTSSG